MFNEDLYRRERFGVYSGKVTNVVLCVVPSLVSWIVSWADVMKVLKPKGLVDACRKKAAAIGKW